uniref:Uncharacterized protein n=1 Tax=Magallana gigas TaxID=29159 RepID=A0A8W8M830_MAGGI
MKYNVRIDFVILLLLDSFEVAHMQICQGPNGTMCCFGYEWDQNQSTCIPCKKGYHGKNCDAKCPPLFFGLGCQSQCNCSDKDCDYISGCRQLTEEKHNDTLIKDRMIIMQTVLTSKDTAHYQSKRLMYAIIGLSVAAVLITITYIYTCQLEKPCDEGYYGSNCSSKCRFPMYGVNCMSNCNCSAINCHHVYGCVKSEEACENGFTGINCVTKCQYPTYGQGCQSLCDCNATVCDYVNGCINASENHQNQSTIHINYKNTTRELMITRKDNVINGESTSNVTDNTAKNYTSSCYNKETESSRVHSLMVAVIGFTSVSFIVYMVYIYTRVLGKRQKNLAHS